MASIIIWIQFVIVPKLTTVLIRIFVKNSAIMKSIGIHFSFSFLHLDVETDINDIITITCFNFTTLDLDCLSGYNSSSVSLEQKCG